MHLTELPLSKDALSKCSLKSDKKRLKNATKNNQKEKQDGNQKREIIIQFSIKPVSPKNQTLYTLETLFIIQIL